MVLFKVLIQTLGGLGLFIMGMKMMTEGLQMTAGDKIKKILGAVSTNRVIGFTTGTTVTAVIQSSSATTVMLIGFLGAGMMSLEQAVGVILGANVGTTITGQMIAFKLTKLALPAIAFGVVLKYFSRRRRNRYIGEIVLGFGLLFYGMTVMKFGLEPIKGDPAFIEFFLSFNGGSFSGLLLCVITGAVLTFIIQSSSATIGLTMTLASQGLIEFPAAMALVLGENIGTTVTAQLATIGATNNDTYRAARAHALFNILGVMLILSIFPFFVKLVIYLTQFMGSGGLTEVKNGEVINIARYIANGHSLFNIVNAVFFLIIMPWLIKAAILISPKDKEETDSLHPPHFDDRFMDNSIAAMAQARGEVIRMSHSSMIMLKNTMKCLESRNVKSLNKWRRYEIHIDTMQTEIINYLTRISQSKVTETEAKEISSLMRMVNNVERIGDSVENIALMIEDIIENDIRFSPDAIEDVNKISDRSIEFLHFVTESMTVKPDKFMKHAQILEDDIDYMREEMREAHIDRLRKGICSNTPGLMFSDILSNYEHIGDYCYNIAQAVAGIK